MTSTGYPDFQRPRDYLAGLAPTQVLAQLDVTNGIFTGVYTVPAGVTVAITYIQLQMSMLADATAGAHRGYAYVQLNATLDGSGAGTTILIGVELVCLANQSLTDSSTMERPIQVKGRAGPGTVIIVNTLGSTNLADMRGNAVVYGTTMQ